MPGHAQEYKDQVTLKTDQRRGIFQELLNPARRRIVMIYITQLIYIFEGHERIFDQFESIAIPAIAKYNGRLLLRVRPTETSYLECLIDKPYEIHLAEFDTEQDFENFKQDDERKKFLHLKEQSIRTALLIKGEKI